MKKYILSALVIAAASVGFTATAKADNDFSLHMEPAAAVPLTTPQGHLYDTGMALAAKAMFALTPNFAVGPAVAALYVPRATDNGQNAGTMWQFGGSVRLQTDRRADHTHGWLSNFSPWVDVDAALGVTGGLYRPAGDVAVGVETPLDSNHIAWVGPFVRFTHMFQTSDTQSGMLLDNRDVNVLQVGVSVSFDTPTKPRVVEHTNTVVKHDVVVRKVLVPHETVKFVQVPVQVPAKLELTEKVYFDLDKSVLRWESKDKLDAVVQKLNSQPNVTVKVQGHASSDGAVAHNQTLSAQRTNAVVQYLVAHGVAANRLQSESFGVSHPAGNNTTSEGRERNRRVEFVVSFTSK